MNTRTFISALLGFIISSWNALTARKGYKPLLKQVFPKSPEELPGLYCHYIHGNQVFSFKIIREFDDMNDTFEGKYIDNSRRNKWWANAVNGDVVLICTGSKFNDPDTLFFKNV